MSEHIPTPAEEEFVVELKALIIKYAPRIENPADTSNILIAAGVILAEQTGAKPEEVRESCNGAIGMAFRKEPMSS